MSTLVIGTNVLEDCTHAFSIAKVPLFAVYTRQGAPIVTFELRSPPASVEIRVQENRVVSGGVSVVSERPAAVAIRLNESTLLRVAVQGPEEVRVELDLRPVGLNVYTKEDALRIGGATLSGNMIRRCDVAFALD